jgi:hypothetical protein
MKRMCENDDDISCGDLVCQEVMMVMMMTMVVMIAYFNGIDIT